MCMQFGAGPERRVLLLCRTVGMTRTGPSTRRARDSCMRQGRKPTHDYGREEDLRAC